MKPIFIILFILPFFYIENSFGQNPAPETSCRIRPKIKKITRDIAKGNVLNDEFCGYGRTKTKQWERFEKLKEEASNDELVKLTDNKNSVVKCYSFRALALRKNINIFPILLKHINDTSMFSTRCECIITSSSVGDYFLEVVTPQYIDSEAYKLTLSQKATVDSILIFDKTIKIAEKYLLLSKLMPNPLYYDRIKEIVATEKSPAAILALARFQNKNDIETIKTLFNNNETEYFGICSAKDFPDTSFYPYLIKIFKRKWQNDLIDELAWKTLFQALARYPTKQTYDLFEQTTEITNEYRHQILCEYLLIAIIKYPNKLFDPLRAMIKTDDFYYNRAIQDDNE